ncbi:MAG: hypothetical protein KBS59_06325, partial [Clostridiales bacterium]|nr:hypothetical protein [Clostridiales bacterium]
SSRIKAKYYVVQKGSDTSFVYDGRYYEKRQLPLSISKYDSGKMNSTYVGAMMAEYLETRDILLSCKYATAVSMMTDESCGIFRHVPGRAEVEQTLKQYGIDLSQL